MPEILELPPPPSEASRILKMAEILEVKNYQRLAGAKGEEKGGEGGGKKKKKREGRGKKRRGKIPLISP